MLKMDLFDREWLGRTKRKVFDLSDDPSVYATPEVIFELQNARSLLVIANSLSRIAAVLEEANAKPK